MKAVVDLPVWLVPSILPQAYACVVGERWKSAVGETDEMKQDLGYRLELCCAVTSGALWLVKLDGKLSAGVEAEAQAFPQVGHTATTRQARA